MKKILEIWNIICVVHTDVYRDVEKLSDIV